jgi:MFS family permease
VAGYGLAYGVGLITGGRLGDLYGRLHVAVAHTGGLGWVLPALVLDGVGTGLAIAPLAATVLSRVPPGQAGAAAGLLSTVQQLGNSLGVAVIGIVFYAGLGAG